MSITEKLDHENIGWAIDPASLENTYRYLYQIVRGDEAVAKATVAEEALKKERLEHCTDEEFYALLRGKVASVAIEQEIQILPDPID